MAEEPVPNFSLLGDQAMRLVDEAVALADADGTVVYWNPAASRMFGWPSAEVVGRSIVEIVSGSANRDAATDILRRVQAGGSWNGAWHVPHADGSFVSAEVSIAPTFASDGTFVGLAAVGRDVTARERSGHELHASHRIFDALLHVTGDILAIVDQSATIRSVLGPVQDRLGVEPEDLVGTTLFELLSPDDLERAQALWATRVSTTDDMAAEDFWIKGDDDTWSCLSMLAGNLLHDPDVGAIVLTARDVTDRKHLEHARLTLAGTNAALVHATTEDDLFEQICRILVHDNIYHLAWIGLADPSTLLGVRMAGVSANALAFFEALQSLAGEEHYGGPLTTTLESQAISVVNDIAALDEAMPWRTLALEHGYRSMIALPIPMSAGQLGVLSIYSEHSHAFSTDAIEVLTDLARALAHGVDGLRARVERATYKAQFDSSLEASVQAVAAAGELRDPYTAGHQRHVAQLAVAIATELGLDAELTIGIGVAASIHDIGKLAVPAEILSKPGQLSANEYALMKEHPQAGRDIVASIDFPWPVAEMVLEHHERLDGSGYPYGLRQEQISVGARVIAVADTVEAMQAHRPYRPAVGLPAALDTIAEGRGTLFDAATVDACISVFQQRGFAFAP
jgi:PAS domain S-box-containing protein